MSEKARGTFVVSDQAHESIKRLEKDPKLKKLRRKLGAYLKKKYGGDDGRE